MVDATLVVIAALAAFDDAAVGSSSAAMPAASASPATGLLKRHQAEQGALVADALGHSVRQEIRRARAGEGAASTTQKAGKATA